MESMIVSELYEDILREKVAKLSPHFNERTMRIYLAVEAQSLGRGGVSQVAAVTGVTRVTIYKGLEDLNQENIEPDRVRRPGAGRKAIEEKQPGLAEALDKLVDPATRGDPMSALRWTSKSTRHLAKELQEGGFEVSHVTVADLLKEDHYSLQANAKTEEGKSSHPDRDAQFKHINEESKKFLKEGLPVISVDTKKKELVGNFKNAGREWNKEKQPERVNVHDFPDPELGKAIPYGVYDVGLDKGWVNVGKDNDTAAFAVESIRRWWYAMGSNLYPKSKQLLICADAGGSNGYRVRLWKSELSKLAAETGLTINVCHLPPGTSKWNKIEHRLFSHISMNWRGRPLISYETIVELIGATKTKTGLTVKTAMDTGLYPTQIKISDKELKKLPITYNKFHGEWNYSIAPI
jgi:transposase